MTDDLRGVQDLLERYGQAHLLTFRDALNAAQLTLLIAQIQSIDFDSLDELIAKHVHDRAASAPPDDLEPAPYYPWDHESSGRPWDRAAMREAGEALIRRGRVAAFTVAGGQGTRLGWNGPKGTYPATSVSGKPLFRVFAEQILATEKKYGVQIPWYIMTSPANDAATRAYFLDNNNFGLQRKNIFLFPQGMMPSLDAQTGRILLASKHEIALNPDGHGGSIKALQESGALEDMQARGIEHVSYFQVDNPAVRAVDPVFIGLHAHADDSSGEMSSKMVAKTDPEEKVGVFCRSQSRTRVIEYSDLQPSLAGERDEQGDLKFNAGSIAIHMISVAFVEQLTADRHHFALPYHRAMKKVPFIDIESGQRIEPDEPNAVKLETFVFDAIPIASSSIVLETDRVEEFAPIKNASGTDSPATSHALQTERSARWLEMHGVKTPRDDAGVVQARLEISPLTGLESADLVAVDLPKTIEPGSELLL